MRNTSSTWILLALVVLTGCTWSNTVWLISPDQKASKTIELLPANKPPTGTPIALVEAKALKSWDSHGDLLASNIKKAMEIGADKIWCPPSDATKKEMFGIGPSLPTKEEIGVIKEFLTSIVDLVKTALALPVTFRSEAISSRTLLCTVYRS